MISKEFATTYLMTSITGKRTTQKCKQCDWFAKREFSNKNSVYITPKNDRLYNCFWGKKF